MDTDNKFFYANGVEIAVTSYDFSLKFLRLGLPEGATFGGTINVPSRLDECIIAMSPGHAKAMLSSLYKSVLDYENNIGSITLDSEAQKVFMETFGALLNK